MPDEWPQRRLSDIARVERGITWIASQERSVPEAGTVAVVQIGNVQRDRIDMRDLFGQEINPSTFAMSRMNAFIHDMDAETALGDTMRGPRFTTDDGGLRRFDIVTANPMWNQGFPQSTCEADPYERFEWGASPSSTADWGWVQHMFRSLKDGGRMAVVLDSGAVSEKVATWNIAEVLVRYVTPERLRARSLAAGDLLVEMSGGSEKQAAGRALLVTDDTLAASDCPTWVGR